ncbi:MarR family transcriptional regulator [Aneurinibacillus sp. UBA3580]|jgi:DNA-binding MarR family transcriptional regulator|uniref:MarR family transcriptional regulator n=1 Tax=Aneurinibacillus sp. UBA3580 TaxID=1946041 RepID=UPI00257D9CF1|nr:helix-turn-helix domain-containing protein [Aneurinibacillus sp. UBA3580]
MKIRSDSSNYIRGPGESQEEVVRNKIPLESEKRKLENGVCNRLFVEQMINDLVLTSRERQLLRYIYRRPDASKREIAEAVGFKHHEQVSRTLDKIREKLKEYKGEALL